ncbi:MAG: glycerophosphodiester phosphodiesterase [Euryarchaeota archaeon]|nr:glycerophosphodiester phosphodiesterase [Euryarchaeota archaeon]
MLILAHRGYSAKYPPNTLLAFKKAIEFGADGVELDVWLTKDGMVIVSHDGNLKETAGADVDIKESTYEELKKYNIDGEPLPLLEEVYKSLPENALINVEIKDFDAVEKSLEIVKRYNALERTMFSSFDLKALKKLRKLNKEARIGILVGEVNKIFSLPYWIHATKAEFLNIPHQMKGVLGVRFSRFLIKFYRLFGVKIVLWTVNSREDVAGLEDLSEVLITDEVEKMLQFRGS